MSAFNQTNVDDNVYYNFRLDVWRVKYNGLIEVNAEQESIVLI